MHFFEFLYYFGLSAKKYLSSRNRKRLPAPVISVGNLTTGGTGKTPAVVAIAKAAKGRGLQPIILTRGYRGTLAGPCFVTRGEGPLLSPREAGDEAFLIAEKLRGVPIVKGPDRYEAGMLAVNELATGPSTLFLLDDGFQHFRLHRDLDIVLIDAAKPFGNGLLLPFGSLREPLSCMRRADVIVITKSESIGEDGREAIRGEIRKFNPAVPVFFERHDPVRLRLLTGEEKSPALIEGAKVFGFCGLGGPDSFRRTIRGMGADLAGWKKYPDHYSYRVKDLEAIRAEAERCGAEWIVTTEKDIIKLRNLNWTENVLIIEIEFSVEDAFYEKIFG